MTATPENSGAGLPISGQEQSLPRGHPPVDPETGQDMVESGVESLAEQGQEAVKQKEVNEETS